jgi:hypothetical protein
MTRGTDPAELRHQAAKLRAGVVLRLYQPIAEKIKLHVLIAASADRSLGFIINTRPSPFVASNADFMRRQVPLTKADHRFLHHDSFIACHDTVRLDPTNVLAKGLCDGTATLLGYIERDVCELICEAVEGSKLISQRDQKTVASVFAYRLRK